MEKPDAKKTDVKEREFWLAIRQAALAIVDAVERYRLDMNPRTADLRKEQGKRR